MESLTAGTAVRIVGLRSAAHHNGKIGRVSEKAAEQEGRVGVDLGKGKILAVRSDNLEVVSAREAEEEAEKATAGAVAEATAAAMVEQQKTLKRDNSLLHEFDGSSDPNVLALYYHCRDREFDCFNATEYNTQMLAYYAAAVAVVAVVPRQMKGNDYLLVCLQHKSMEKNTLCQVAFQCMRHFAGISMLIKVRCFACGKPGAPRCSCQCACFCSDCEKSEIRVAHTKLCGLIRDSSVTTEEDTVAML